MHPFGGLDRILTVTAAGLFAYQLGGRALSLVLSAFVLAMGVSGSMGAIDARLPYVEATIARQGKIETLMRGTSPRMTCTNGRDVS